LVVPPVNNAAASATHLTCLKLPAPDALTRLGDSRGHIKRGISRILHARAYLDLLAFCTPFSPDHMSVISSTGRGALALFFPSHESSCKVSPDCYTMSAHHVLGLGADLASHTRKCPRCNEAPSKSRGSRSSSTVSGTSMSGERPQLLCLRTTSPGTLALGTSFRSTIGLSTCFKSSCPYRCSSPTPGQFCNWEAQHGKLDLRTSALDLRTSALLRPLDLSTSA
jgi:hypothetical protein